MKTIASLLGLILWGITVFGQQPNGLTGIRDTSFTVYATYHKLKNTYPQIRIVEPVLPSSVTAKTDLVYYTVGDRRLHLDVFFPTAKSSKPRPAVLLIHGGGWRSGDRSQQVPMAQHLAAQGFVAVTAEYRLSTEALYPAAVHDLKTALRWMRAHANAYGIDTTRIATLGCSAGGQLAALLSTTGNPAKLEGSGGYPDHSSAVQAVVDVDGILAFIHPESGEGDDRKSTSAATYWFGASKTQKPELWHEASALTYVGRQSPPMLFLNSSVDRMHAGRDDLVAQLKKNGIYSEVHTFPDAPHPFWLFHPWFEPTMTYTVNFLRTVFGMK